MKVKRRILILLLCTLAFQVCSKDEEYVDMINISNTQGRSEYPAIAADSRGYFYVVWEEQLFSKDSLFIYTAIREPSGEWSEPEKIFELQWATFPDIEIDQHNTIHVVWRDTDEDGWGEELYTKKKTGCMWTEPETLSVYGMSCQPDFVVDYNGTVHLVWLEWPTYYSPLIYYAQKEVNGSWSAPVEVSEGYVACRGRPRIATSPTGQVHIVWEELEDFGNPDLIMHCTNSSDNEFTPPHAIAYSDYYLDAQIDPALTIDCNGTVHTVWHQDDDVFYTFRDPDAEWNTPIRICSTETHSMLPNIAAGADGGVRLVWFEDNYKLAYRSLDSEHKWSDIEYYLVDNVNTMEPKLAIGTNSIGVVFQVAIEFSPSGRANTEIFFVEVPMY